MERANGDIKESCICAVLCRGGERLFTGHNTGGMIGENKACPSIQPSPQPSLLPAPQPSLSLR